MSKASERQAVIIALAAGVQQRAATAKSGSVCLVPSASEPGKKHRVEVDENYVPVSCDCRGGRYNCQHKLAVMAYFMESRPRLLKSPLYEFRRAGVLIRARLAQFSKAEKAALAEAQEKARQEAAEQAARRELYNSLFDPNGIECGMYA